MVIWLIGMSGAGKTVIGRALYARIKERFSNSVFLDGDLFRNLIGDQLGHTMKDRKANADRMCRLCEYLDIQNINVVCSILSIFPESREWNRKTYQKYFEVYLKVSMEELKKRDSKGLYAKARAGKIKDIVGIDIEFPEPDSPDETITNNGGLSPNKIAANLFQQVKGQLVS